MVTRMFVVPPAAAAPPLIARMYDTGAAPVLPVAEKLPDPRGWSALSIVLFSVWVCSLVLGAPSPPLYRQVVKLLLFWAAVVCAIMRWIRKRQLRRVLEDPVRMAIMRWAPTLPPFAVRR